MKRIFLFMSSALVSVSMLAGLRAGEVTELKLYSTNFQNWPAAKSSTTPATEKVTTRYSNEELTFTYAETEINPTGTHSKFTADVISTGYAMSAKKSSPYIETSELKSVTKVHYVHAATGGDRGWGLQYKAKDDADWVTAHSKCCEQAGTAVDVAINKENVKLRWYNLNASQNAYMTELAIYGMAEDDGSPNEYTITYFDQDGNNLGEKIQTELETLVFAYSEKDLKIPEGYKFRGWYDSDKKRHNEGEAISEDMRLNALVTPIEKAETGKFYVYNIASNVFYADDHECFIPTNGAYHNEHGWHFSAGGTISLPVGGNAYVKIGLCKHSDEGNIVVKTKSGADVTSIASKGETDNTIGSFFYSGKADTLVLTFEKQAYIHSVAVYNVKAKAEKDEYGYYEIAGGDAAAFLMVIDQLADGDKIFLQNGLYDLGEKVLTLITKNNVSIIGQSMEGVIIKNAPPVKQESIDNTATLKINDNVTGTYIQDLTIQNALDYYKANNGRAVCLQDRGSQTVCKNVRLLSYQDTYYSNKQGAVKYFEDCEIHGTVDFICGDGSVYFKNSLLVAEKRSTGGGGTDALTASNAAATDKGYVFDGGRIRSENAFTLGRLWNNAPQCVFLNMVVEKPADLASSRWTLELMSDEKPWPGKAGHIGEYNLTDTEGKVITPASNNVEFFRGSSKQSYETVLKADEAAVYTPKYTLGAWAETAQNDAKQAVALPVAEDGIYLIENPGGNCFITTGEELNKADLMPDATIRRANARGGFGWKAGEEPKEGFENTAVCNSKVMKIIRNGQVVIIRDGKEYNVLGTEL